MIKRGLIVKEPFATMIIKGIKKWELRKKRTSIRERIYIISNGTILGSVKIKDVIGPFTIEELREYYEFHRVSYDFLVKYAENKELYAWVLEDPIPLNPPKKIKLPKGAQIWVRIKEEW